MMYEFATSDGKKPDPSAVPTHVSLGGTEYKVVDGCLDAPARYQKDLETHGFRVRQRDRVSVGAASTVGTAGSTVSAVGDDPSLSRAKK